MMHSLAKRLHARISYVHIFSYRPLASHHKTNQSIKVVSLLFFRVGRERGGCCCCSERSIHKCTQQNFKLKRGTGTPVKVIVMSLTFKKSKVYLGEPANKQSTICSVGRFKGQTQTLLWKNRFTRWPPILPLRAPSTRNQGCNGLSVTLEEEEFDKMKAVAVSVGNDDDRSEKKRS